MEKSSIGARMKRYENAYKIKFTDRLPVIIRLDGKAFHTLVRNSDCKKPFDENVIKIFNVIMLQLLESIQGCVFAYTQSDEISLLLYPWKKNESQAWFDNEMTKINSISSAIASALGTQLWGAVFKIDSLVLFDSRSFVLPESEVVNYFIWRQKDWMRNSIQMLARTRFSQKKLHGLSNIKVKSLLEEDDGTSWDELHDYLKYGRCAYYTDDGDKFLDKNIPEFTKNRDFIEWHFIQKN